ncbi:hypothetical protein FSW04_01325 [Baekduia soli]|uniref:Uncharacterized protein n=1 Tax=Baekduia soli TaxID=496014 RepID=A0A5B8U034_9ACTN|nr:hypothetical protein [Baekduia soli]QEC46349.1 hypothetical protein FSW04_01325 [Baekduia soli]
MATTRTRTSKRAGASSRFGRPTTAPKRSISRSPGRSSKRSHKSSTSAALSGLGALLGSSGAKGRRTKGKGKTGGLALLAGAAGLAFKNRDKLTSKFAKHDDRHGQGDAYPPAYVGGVNETPGPPSP